MSDHLETNPLKVNRKNINNFKNKRISLIAEDLESIAGVDPRITAKVLTARGITRLFNSRKEVISLQRYVKQQIRGFYGLLASETIKKPNKRKADKKTVDYYRWLGRMEGFDLIKKKLDEILKESGLEMPVGDTRFEELFNCSSKELMGTTTLNKVKEKVKDGSLVYQ